MNYIFNKKVSTRFSLALAAAIAILASSAPLAASAYESSPDPAVQEALARDLQKELVSSQDPEAVLSALNSEEEQAFRTYSFPAKVEQIIVSSPLEKTGESVSRELGTQVAAAATATCKGSYVRMNALNSLGDKIWSVFTEGKWCWSGSKVTSATFGRSWSEIYQILWRDAGQIGKGAGVQSGSARIFAQRKMIAGTGGWDIQTWQPCLRLLGYSGATLSSDRICSIY